MHEMPSQCSPRGRRAMEKGFMKKLSFCKLDRVYISMIHLYRNKCTFYQDIHPLLPSALCKKKRRVRSTCWNFRTVPTTSDQHTQCRQCIHAYYHVKRFHYCDSTQPGTNRGLIYEFSREKNDSKRITMSFSEWKTYLNDQLEEL